MHINEKGLVQLPLCITKGFGMSNGSYNYIYNYINHIMEDRRATVSAGVTMSVQDPSISSFVQIDSHILVSTAAAFLTTGPSVKRDLLSEHYRETYRYRGPRIREKVPLFIQRGLLSDQKGSCTPIQLHRDPCQLVGKTRLNGWTCPSNMGNCPPS